MMLLKDAARPRKLTLCAHAAVGLGTATAALVIAGCGSAKVTTVTDTVTDTVVRTTTVKVAVHAAEPKPSSATQTTTTPPASNGHTETVKDFNGDTLSVESIGLVDPATPASSFDDPPTGTRLVAVEWRLSNRSSGTIADDADSDTTLIGSDGQDYTPVFSSVSECTNFSHGSYTLLDGDSVDGCVVFQLATGLTVKAVQFALGGNTVQFNAH
jgi:hypothetical protein